MGRRRLTKEEFIEKAIKVHGNKYDYSKSIYLKNSIKVEIICKKHGDFLQTPRDHLTGVGCPKCKGEKTTLRCLGTKQSFVRKAIEIHGNKYDYSLVEYEKSNIKVDIVCAIHGVFKQRPNDHLNGKGCIFCSGKNKKTKDMFIKEVKILHRGFYCYDKVFYENRNSKVIIICPKHGDFLQTPASHLAGQGCPKCKVDSIKRKLSSTKKKFEIEARKIHGDKYEYDLVVYKNANTCVKILCKEHGVFLQTPANHLHSKQNCPKCASSKAEILINNYLENNNFHYKHQFRIKECKDKRSLPFDFAIFADVDKTNLKYLIEYDGEQHYGIFEFHKGGFEKIQKRDKIKTDYCLKNNIKLIRIPYWEKNNIEKILSKELTIS